MQSCVGWCIVLICERGVLLRLTHVCQVPPPREPVGVSDRVKDLSVLARTLQGSRMDQLPSAASKVLYRRRIKSEVHFPGYGVVSKTRTESDQEFDMYRCSGR
ncbi:uncharacterized protein EI90DRAFT_3031675 [Cantharellus anzutake]|uniref:uncharacterized protein n=1 Tax=Cantharellus anzutake TaxID=1750568 RepID=UPI0019038AB9|nr:uncharacterized protein EI90DRAFT_3031675 [Cantharellus anzutake]KAF8343191.1 hypothetical protein EI90DRAFT_3031675 [Cantharellus anzutake]